MEGKKELENKIKECRAMAIACEARGEYLLQKFYTNATKGFKLKLHRKERECK